MDDEAAEAVEQLGEGANGQHAEGHEQDVAGEHVGEQTNGVAQRASDEHREQFDEADEASHEGVLHAWWPHDVFEVAECRGA